MLRELRKIGDGLDRCDAAGWLLLLTGVFIVAVVILTPAWLDVRELAVSRSRLHRQLRLLELQEQNYGTLVRAIDRADPMVMRRLAWHYLNLKPAGAEPLDPAGAMRSRPVTISHWVRPSLPPAPRDRLRERYLPETRLTRLVSGYARPWVLAFGGWLILVGLLINPTDAPDYTGGETDGVGED